MRKISILFPEELFKRIETLASVRGESLGQVIVRLAEIGLRKECGNGKVNIDKLRKVVGSIPAGGDALEDAEDIY